jgi:hypothetical protein
MVCLLPISRWINAPLPEFLESIRAEWLTFGAMLLNPKRHNVLLSTLS